MYHPTSRVLIVLELLQARPLISGPALAERLEVDVRTVRHYITMLQDIGIPVETVLGRHGGYRLRPGFKLPPLMFSNEEVLALMLGLMVVQKLGVGDMTSASEGAIARIERVLPLPLRGRAKAIQEMLVLGMTAPETVVERIVVETLSLAAQQGQQVRIRYHNKIKQETERVIDPYGVVCHEGKWYAVGYCHLRASLRVFRLDRIQQVEVQKELFTRPTDFNILDAIIQSFVAIPDVWNIEVLLKLSLAEARRKVPASLATLTLEPLAQGILFSASIHSLDYIARFLVSLGCSFEIRQPVELKLALRTLAEEIIQLAI
ncbi:helix-turn-helix transcriptional regulator [Dictyobacter arantiisoli]|uniref:Transcriptional regulator n=1 Tax=Dictyobacter arantiisoli TaxID=2014874 RepID=A0A5A5TFY9_9CHLR|nr:YafY family protein [Dictyobacter arantiisoli]GCF09909.1 transcriptional regulator [Dictyobacter arantiisoli]